MRELTNFEKEMLENTTKDSVEEIYAFNCEVCEQDYYSDKDEQKKEKTICLRCSLQIQKDEDKDIL